MKRVRKHGISMYSISTPSLFLILIKLAQKNGETGERDGTGILTAFKPPGRGTL